MKTNMEKIYLDNAATTQVDERVAKTMMPYFSEKFGNASSKHSFGFEAKKVLEDSREIIAKSINAEPEEIIFTSGGTESNNLALKGIASSNPQKNHIITSKIEHDSVLNPCRWLEKRGIKITYLGVDKEGFINLEELKKSITSKTLLVSIIHANNEIGTIQDIEKIGKICREKKVLFHTDACQSYTKAKIDVKKQNIDLMTLNAHKIHGPKGVGALYIRKGIRITPLLHGGGHENNLRSGTENIPGIVGFAEAVKISKPEHAEKMRKLRDMLINSMLKIPGTKLNGAHEKRLCNNINISFSNIEGEAVCDYMNSYNIFLSTGSACSSKSLEPSHVLASLGMPEIQANSSVRISLSRFNTEKEIKRAAEILSDVVNKLRGISPFKV